MLFLFTVFEVLGDLLVSLVFVSLLQVFQDLVILSETLLIRLDLLLRLLTLLVVLYYGLVI